MKLGSRTHRRILAWAGFVTAAANAAAILSPMPGALRVPFVLAFACVGPGAAIVAHVPLADAVVTWALTLTLSLALFAAISAAMAFAGLWHVQLVSTVLSVGTAISCGSVLVMMRHGRVARRVARQGPERMASS